MPTGEIHIRRCVPADAPALGALACRTFRETFADTCTAEDMQMFLRRNYNESRLLLELADPEEQVHFAEVDGVPVGYIRFYEAVPPFPHPVGLPALELSRLYVDKASQGSGVAQELMNHYLSFARAEGYCYLWLGVWEHNLRAQAFYRKWGFSSTGHTHPFPIESTPQTDQWWARLLREDFL